MLAGPLAQPVECGCQIKKWLETCFQSFQNCATLHMILFQVLLFSILLNVFLHLWHILSLGLLIKRSSASPHMLTLSQDCHISDSNNDSGNKRCFIGNEHGDYFISVTVPGYLWLIFSDEDKKTGDRYHLTPDTGGFFQTNICRCFFIHTKPNYDFQFTYN